VNGLDPRGAALYALIAICLVLVGAILTLGQLGVAERGTVLAGIVAILFAIAWRHRSRE
jgi:hypothetical protein